MYEALLRERMDAEQQEELDAALDVDEELDMREKAEFHTRAGGEVSLA